MQRVVLMACAVLLATSFSAGAKAKKQVKSGNPIVEGWYADPHAMVYGKKYWVYPTYSALYEKQVFLDCFSSDDLVHWTKHHAVLDTAAVKWAKKCLWAPASLEKDGKYYLFFGANDVHPGEIGGIGVAVADAPQGPYRDLLGKPLINDVVNGAQPIDQFVYEEDGQYYMYYGGWGHCNLVKLKSDFTGLEPFPDGQYYKEVTPERFVEGVFMFRKDGKYYFMWSEGGWGSPDYCVAYAISDSLEGPFVRRGKILEQDFSIATGAGHHSVIRVPGTDKWYIFYHRRPLDNKHRDHRVMCVEEMHFGEDGSILPVKLTFDGVAKQKVRK